MYIWRLDYACKSLQNDFRMRRLVTLLVTIALLAPLSQSVAQGRYTLLKQPKKSMEMGVSIGATAAFMNLDAAGVDLSPKVGVRAALEMALVWQDEYAMQIELAYLHNNIDTSRGGVEYDLKSNVMEIPIMFSYRGWGPMRFNVGPVLSLAAAGRYSNGAERIEFGRMRPTVGYTAGIGVELSQHVVIDARFTGGLARTDNYFEGVEFRSSAYWVALGVSYLF